MADFELKLDDESIVRQAQAAFKEANEVFGRDAAKAITDKQWGWPTDPSPRDIVDTGQLRGSYEPSASSNDYEHSWGMEYAAANHNGAILKNGGVLAARPWTKEPLSKFEGNFQKLLDGKLK